MLGAFLLGLYIFESSKVAEAIRAYARENKVTMAEAVAEVIKKRGQ